MTAARWCAAAVALLLSGPAFADPSPLLVQAEGQTVTPVCSNSDLQIEGNHNVVKPFGVCHSLLIKGVANQVILDLGGGAAIRVEGGQNQVTYRAETAAASVDLLGDGNMATAQMTPAPEAGVVLQLVGDDQARSADCTGRAVTIQGARALYVLRGGCKSLTIQGDLVVVQAEMLPGAAIGITGHGVRVGWALAGAGKSPTAALHGEANHVERLDLIGGLPLR